MEYLRYEESRPDEMRAMIEKKPIAYAPFGALEWHGEHAPLGLDGLKAYAICEAAAARTGGVLFPTVYWGAFDTMPFPFTFHFEKSGIVKLVRAMLTQLDAWGFKAIVLLTGHYPPTQVKLLKTECIKFNKRGGALALGIPEQALATDIDYFGDHAGMWETSMMMAIRPDLVDLSAMPKGLPTLERLDKYGVMGHDPGKASAELGRKAIDHIVGKLAAAVERVLAEKNDLAFNEIYESHAKAMKIFSPRAYSLAKKALDVRSIGELIRYGLWNWRKM